MAVVRSLTPSGVEQFRQYLERLAAGAAEPPPVHLLTDEPSSQALTGHAEVELHVFASKQAAAEHLTERLGGLHRTEVDHSVGLWSWLSLFYFDQVCPPAADGTRDPGEIERHIPSQ